jgi:hypothetical protein
MTGEGLERRANLLTDFESWERLSEQREDGLGG